MKKICTLLVCCIVIIQSSDQLDALNNPIPAFAHKIKNLKVTTSSEGIALSFIALTEDIKYYVVERRDSENLAFKRIGYLLPSTVGYPYHYEDMEINNGDTYEYRIKSFTLDNEQEISKSVSIKLDKGAMVSEPIHQYVYLFENQIFIRLIVNQLTPLEGGVYNNKGQLIQEISKQSVTKGLSEFKYDVSAFNEGEYIVIIKIGEENIIEKVSITS